MQTRPIKEIAQEIQKDWTSMPHWVKECYFSPLLEIDSIEDDYYADSAKSVVLYFLANATSWRGETARRIKKELKDLCNTVKG